MSIAYAVVPSLPRQDFSGIEIVLGVGCVCMHLQGMRATETSAGTHHNTPYHKRACIACIACLALRVWRLGLACVVFVVVVVWGMDAFLRVD